MKTPSCDIAGTSGFVMKQSVGLSSEPTHAHLIRSREVVVRWVMALARSLYVAVPITLGWEASTGLVWRSLQGWHGEWLREVRGDVIHALFLGSLCGCLQGCILLSHSRVGCIGQGCLSLGLVILANPAENAAHIQLFTQ